MNILITGGLGFVGRQLSALLLDAGHHVTAVGTRPDPGLIDHPHFTYIAADTTRDGLWQEAAAGSDAVVNLAGRTISKRWSQKYKKSLYDSRILTTRNLVKALPDKTAITLCSASGAGYYGDRGDDILSEQEPCGNDFLARLSRDWEAEALKAEAKGARVATLRLAVVLGPGGGALEKMIPAFRVGLGGPLGSGRQWFPWIHLSDLIAAVRFVLEQGSIAGPVNICAPQAVRNRDFARTLGQALSRPAVLPAPRFIIRLILGEFGSALLFSQRPVPSKLLKAGFAFKFPEITGALQDIVTAAP